MAISLVTSSAAAFGNSSATTSAINTTGANCLIMWIGAWRGTQPAPSVAVSDSKGNTWTALNGSGNSTTDGCFFYCLNPTVGSGHTATVNNSVNANWACICLMSFSGVGSVDTPQSTSVSSALVTSLATGSVTPNQANSLIVAGLQYYDFGNSGIVPSINSGFTRVAELHLNSQAPDTCVGYLIQSAAAAVNPTFSFGSTNPVATSAAAVFGPQLSGLRQLAALGAG